ncbi:MAG: hypothetical protein NC820_06935, partial [Candidatus Omnitrophica bacterium]|nr:hypothetical protein [Candidatus Omnitrophota bacterium]
SVCLDFRRFFQLLLKEIREPLREEEEIKPTESVWVNTKNYILSRNKERDLSIKNILDFISNGIFQYKIAFTLGAIIVFLIIGLTINVSHSKQKLVSEYLFEQVSFFYNGNSYGELDF